MIQKVNMEKSWSSNNVGIGCSSALIGHLRYFIIKVGCGTVDGFCCGLCYCGCWISIRTGNVEHSCLDLNDLECILCSVAFRLPICQTTKVVPKVMNIVELQMPGNVAVHDTVFTRVQDETFTLNLGLKYVRLS